MRGERKAVFEIEGQGKVRVKGYKQRFSKIVFLEKEFLSNVHAKGLSYSPSTALIPPYWAPTSRVFCASCISS
jgi:hypothetical protein